MGFKGSKVQILSSRPEISRGYGENRNPFLYLGRFGPALAPCPDTAAGIT